MAGVTIVQGTNAKLQFQVVNDDGPVLLTSATIKFRYMKSDGTAVVTPPGIACSIVVAADGTCETTAAVDFSGEAAPGQYIGELYLSWTGEKFMSYQFPFRVVGHLPGSLT